MRTGIEASLGPFKDIVAARGEAICQPTGSHTVGAFEIDMAVGADVDCLKLANWCCIWDIEEEKTYQRRRSGYRGIRHRR